MEGPAMSSKNGQVMTTKKKAKPIQVELHVAPLGEKATREVVAKWADRQFTDKVDTSKASAREKFVERLAEEWDIDDVGKLKNVKALLVEKAQEADELAEQAAQEAAEQAAQEAADEAISDEPENKSAKALEATPEDVKAAAEAFLNNPNLMEELAADFEKLGIAGETRLAQTVYVVGTSRKLPEPLGASTKSASASGKSFVNDMVASLFPEEDLLRATDITANALYYLPPGALQHKLVSVGERKHMSAGNEADTANATLALREMMSRGYLDKYVPGRGEGGIVTLHIHQEGPIAYLETTTQQEIFEEDATRMLSLATNESSEQTAAIMAMQAKQAKSVSAGPDEQQQIRLKHQTAQRMLASYKVSIPFAEKLALPPSKLVARRAFPQLLAFIKAVALLRQFQKKVKPDGHIVATANDYEFAFDLMLPILRRTFAPLSQRALALRAAVLANSLQGQSFTRADCQKWSGVGLTEVRNRLSLLVEVGFVEQISGGRGTCYSYRITTTKGGTAPTLDGLITPDELRKQLEEAKNKADSAKKQPSANHK
jgi:hypothetical protein